MHKWAGEIRAIVEREHCSEEAFKKFFADPCWQELVDTLHTRLAITRDELEMVEGKELYRCQGDARSIRFALAMEELIMSEFATVRSEKEIDDAER